jgi:hypothetical protein
MTKEDKVMSNIWERKSLKVYEPVTVQAVWNQPRTEEIIQNP